MINISKRHFFYKNLLSTQRIGPHNIDTISIIIGSLLADSHLEKRNLGSRLIFEQCSKNVEYLMWFHSHFADRGYCSNIKPKLKIRIKKEGRFFYYRIYSYTFSYFNYFHNLFYKLDPLTNKYIKIIPIELFHFLTPQALAIWFMDNGSKFKNGGYKIATNCFTYNEIEYLSFILKNKFNLKCNIHSSGINKGFIIYIFKSSRDHFFKLVKPYMVPSMYYKLG